MALIIESPNEVYSLENESNLKIFLAGSITDCEDWQEYVIEKIKHIEGITIYNPRRENFPIEDPNAAEEQIIWEYKHLKNADALVFWFDRGSLAPIVLYELGKHVNSNKEMPAIIGIDPEYKRKQDVIIQTRLERPNQIFTDNLDELIRYISIMKTNPKSFK